MQLLGFEESKFINLISGSRPDGPAYLPEVALELGKRYSFAKLPNLDDLIDKNKPKIFRMGKFNDVQIDEFGIYTDGVMVLWRCNTDILDGFAEDALKWFAENYGFVESVLTKPEKHYESVVIVQSAIDLAAPFAANGKVTGLIETAIRRESPSFPKYIPSGFFMDCDPAESKSKRKPSRFMIERKLGLPFEDNVFYCSAPLSTKHHLALLERLEEATA